MRLKTHAGYFCWEKDRGDSQREARPTDAGTTDRPASQVHLHVSLLLAKNASKGSGASRCVYVCVRSHRGACRCLWNCSGAGWGAECKTGIAFLQQQWQRTQKRENLGHTMRVRARGAFSASLIKGQQCLYLGIWCVYQGLMPSISSLNRSREASCIKSVAAK